MVSDGRRNEEARLDLKSNEQISALCAEVCSGGAPAAASMLRRGLSDGADPLGSAYESVNSSDSRRASGSTYTPLWLVRQMVEHAASVFDPDLIVDCGCGSGRFTLACAEAFPDARIVAVDSSDLACSMCRANVAASGYSKRVEVVRDDFTLFDLPRRDEHVLWIGNPPYVRHHDIPAERKEEFKRSCERLGVRGSGLAGLHAHFLAHIARSWKEGDYGLLVMSAEWLDTNYGRAMRDLLSGMLHMSYLRLFDRRTEPFLGTQTTAVVVGFGRSSGEGGVVVRQDGMRGGKREVPLRTFREATRWTSCLLGTDKRSGALDEGSLVPLGSLMRVHRGVVTGNNAFWVRSRSSLESIPESLTVPVVAHARELMGACVAQNDPAALNRLIVLPEHLGDLDEDEADAALRIIAEGEDRGVDKGYIARHRRAWWSVKPPEAPAVLMTYMGRRPPTFVVNHQMLPMLNVVHGLYPVRPLSEKAVNRLVDYLNENVTLDEGRMYCGGLVKFEPREAESIPVPPLDVLEA